MRRLPTLLQELDERCECGEGEELCLYCELREQMELQLKLIQRLAQDGLRTIRSGAETWPDPRD